MTIQELKQTIGTKDLVCSVEHLRMKMRGRRNCTLYVRSIVLDNAEWHKVYEEAERRNIKLVEVEGKG